MSYDLTDLQLFLDVVDRGSITQGAAQTHLSLASASARIKAMEQALGAPLLLRHRRGVTPSPEGWLLVAHARTVVRQWTRMRAELARLADGARNSLPLPANTSAIETLLPTALAEFLAEHPDIDVQAEERPSHEIVAAVGEGRAELGIIADTVDHGGLETQPLRPDPLVVVCPPGHPLAGRPEVSFSECLEHPFVGRGAGNPFQEHLAGQAEPLGLRPRYRARLGGTEAVCRAVAAGIGVAVLPEAAVDRWRAELGLVAVRLDNAWARRSLLLCCRERAALSAPAEAMARHLAG
ncbi:LysR substrate-binding domain-containing protein [Pseudonocardia eucalypti]|uniref:LysR substrate-binding domain-containing protein n=1 Tax=Pseudonocardia eucalypti TaxID=648755 RepID=A0ABP9PVA1_9PSEU|nr:molybdate transport repressor ModE-like protein [Pseudonocardia eucalypti]